MYHLSSSSSSSWKTKPQSAAQSGKETNQMQHDDSFKGCQDLRDQAPIVTSSWKNSADCSVAVDDRGDPERRRRTIQESLRKRRASRRRNNNNGESTSSRYAGAVAVQGQREDSSLPSSEEDSSSSSSSDDEYNERFPRARQVLLTNLPVAQEIIQQQRQRRRRRPAVSAELVPEELGVLGELEEEEELPREEDAEEVDENEQRKGRKCFSLPLTIVVLGLVAATSVGVFFGTQKRRNPTNSSEPAIIVTTTSPSLPTSMSPSPAAPAMELPTAQPTTLGPTTLHPTLSPNQVFPEDALSEIRLASDNTYNQQGWVLSATGDTRDAFSTYVVLQATTTTMTRGSSLWQLQGNGVGRYNVIQYSNQQTRGLSAKPFYDRDTRDDESAYVFAHTDERSFSWEIKSSSSTGGNNNNNNNNNNNQDNEYLIWYHPALGGPRLGLSADRYYETDFVSGEKSSATNVMAHVSYSYHWYIKRVY